MDLPKVKPVKVNIKNFQSIEDISFSIHGFCTIIGRTNVGKSAILRAISGSLLNKPVTNLVRAGSKGCSVQLSSDSWGFLWEKSEKGTNRYTIDGKNEKLENVGQKQPEPIASMGFNSIRIGDRELHPWYASQWSPVFLLDEGGPTVTQFISEISGLEILQKAISLSLKGKKKALDELRTVADEVNSINGKLKKISKLDDLLDMANELESQQKSIKEYEERIELGKRFYSSILNASNSISVLGNVENIKIPKNDINEIIEKTTKMYRIWVKLEEDAKAIISFRSAPQKLPVLPEKEYENWKRIQKYKEIDVLQNFVSKINGVSSVSIPEIISYDEVLRLEKAKNLHKQISILTKSIKAIEKKLPEVSELDLSEDINKIKKLNDIMVSIRIDENSIAELSQKFKEFSNELQKVDDELTSIPSCPTCKRPMLGV